MNSEVCENVEMQIKIDGTDYTLHIDPSMTESDTSVYQYIDTDVDKMVKSLNANGCGTINLSKRTSRRLRRLGRPNWKARRQLRKHGISLKRWEIDLRKYDRAISGKRSNKMKAFFMWRYYPFRDFDRHCKHKMPMQLSTSCRKRRDSTKIGNGWCLHDCPYCMDYGCNRKGEMWIKCAKLKEALDK